MSAILACRLTRCCRNSPFSGDHGGGNELLSNWVLIARVSKDCERTDVTLNGDLLVKVIDEHDVAGHIVSL
jgi:hypothetical protein